MVLSLSSSWTTSAAMTDDREADTAVRIVTEGVS